VPGPRRDTNDLAFIFMVVYDSADTETHDCQRRHILRRVDVRAGEGAYIVGTRYCDFQFTPGKLNKRK
jgi:hypothetical protein